ncbi:hypothetical protein [Loigolactobacillus zhaoyuanensis]|uniref:hypothetical protein n=1 Tax=Loigolactobacillus zhaoyuanensis TaxID=2486017 RepID=UPI000F73CC5F|nr:hypothetical protein [Loigolactobacillus zhaoyuanensis]
MNEPNKSEQLHQFEIKQLEQKQDARKVYRRNEAKVNKMLPAARRYNRQIVTYQQHKTAKPSVAPVQQNLKSPMGYVNIPAINLDGSLSNPVDS